MLVTVLIKKNIIYYNGIYKNIILMRNARTIIQKYVFLRF